MVQNESAVLNWHLHQSLKEILVFVPKNNSVNIMINNKIKCF
jgi:hypothetical protein